MAISVKSDYAVAHNNLGVVLDKRGSRMEAIVHFRHVVWLKPNDANACNNLGNVLLRPCCRCKPL
jgi:protein O-GlcNAc transferase